MTPVAHRRGRGTTLLGLMVLVALGRGAAADPRSGDIATLSTDGTANEEIAYDLSARAERRRPLATPRRGGGAPFVPDRPGDRDPPPPAAGTLHPRLVFGRDQRVYIDETTDFPWRAVCRLVVRFPNDPGDYGGSGVLVGARYVLTAGHVVYDSALGGWADSIAVIPGQDGGYQPYGAAFATQTRTYSGWTDFASRDHDFALLTLDRDIGDQTGWLGFAYYRSYAGVEGNLPGYPLGGHDGTRLFYSHGPIRGWTAFRVFHRIDTEGGQSGSAIYRRKRRNRIVFAVHTGTLGGSNQGTRIDRDKFESLRRWIVSGE